LGIDFLPELEQSQSVSRPAVSQHLQVLHELQLIRVTPNGNGGIYCVGVKRTQKPSGYVLVGRIVYL